MLTTSIEAIVPDTGEIVTVNGSYEMHERNYTIKKLTTRSNMMTLLSVISEICKSSKDIKAINEILDLHNSDGMIIIPNILKKNQELGLAKDKLTTLLKRATENDLFYKESKGVYRINPFMFIGRKVRSNEARERLQMEWKTIKGLI